MNFTVTANAAKRIAELIKQKDTKMLALRIAVDGGGCSGFMYQYKLTDSIDNDDYIAEKNGVKVAIDPISQDFLDGCSVDFIEELGNSFFQINNPKATAKCGCGNSFSV
jgi:iron-sulfur cluster insertion protein